MQKKANVLIVTLWLLTGWAATAAEPAADANYANIIDPVKLAEMSRAVMAAESFDAAPPLSNTVLTDGLAGKGLDLKATGQPLTFDCAEVINAAAGAVSWWVRFRSEVTDASIRLAQVDDGGGMYIMYQGSKAWDVRHRHRLGHYWLNPDLKFIQYPSGICPTPEAPGLRWINIVWTWADNRTQVYVDGELASELTHERNVAGAFARFAKLQLGAPGQDAALDEVRFYNRSLTQPDIRGYIAAVRSSALRENALRPPAEFADRIAGSFRAVYRLSDRALVLYGDLGGRMKEAGAVTVEVAAADGRRILARTVAVPHPREAVRLAIPLPGDLPDGTYRVTLSTGGATPPLQAEFTRRKYDWEGNRTGLSDKVPAPWAPVAFSKPSLAWWMQPEFSVWGRELALDTCGLPCRIRVRQPEPARGPEVANILSGPVRVVPVGEHGTIHWSKASWRIVTHSERQVVIAGSATSSELDLALSGILEFDGLYKVSLRIAPRRKNVPLDRLSIEIPVPDVQAALFNAASDAMRAQKTFLDIERQPDGVLWDSITAITGGPEQVRMAPAELRPVAVWPHAWLGNDDRGLAVMVENTRTWRVDRARPVMDLVRSNGVTTLRLLPVNGPATLTEAIEMTFSLQATPVRPRPSGGTGKTMEWYGWGYFDLPVIAADLEPGAIARPKTDGAPWYRTPEALAENRWWKYGCLQSHRVSPGDSVYGEMVKATRDEWEDGLYTPSHIDFLLWSYGKWHDKESLDGAYFDNTYPQRANGFGSGIASLDSDGNLHPSYNVFGQREFLKRLQCYFQSVGPLPVMMAHVTDCPAVGYLGFADFWLDGENGGYLEYKKQVDHDEGRAKYDFIDRWNNPTGLANLRITLGRQWGPVPKYLYAWLPEPTYAMLGMFDIEHQYEPMGRKPYHEFGRFEPDVRFMPYWMPGRPVTLESGGPDVFLTAWRRPDRVRVLVSNLSREERRVTFRADLAALGLPTGAMALDEREGSSLALQGETLADVPVPPHSYRTFILAKPGLYAPLPPHPAAGFLPPGRRLADFCDDFSTLKPVWTKQVSAESWRCTGDSRNAPAGIKTDPISVSQNHLRIRNGSGLAHNIRHPFNHDRCSVTLKLREPLGLFAPGFGPGLRLVWPGGQEIALTAWERGPAERQDRFHASAPGLDRWGDIPAIVNWMRIDLRSGDVVFLTSNDGKTWKELGSISRAGLAGAPAELIIGHANRADGLLESYNYISFYDELHVAQLE